MAVETAKAIEEALASILKPRGFRKRGRNWFRFTGTDYQVVNLQKSSWGGGKCYLNLGWDPAVEPGTFRSENQCMLTLRAGNLGVIPTVSYARPDGVSEIDVPGLNLLDGEFAALLSPTEFMDAVVEVVATPVADFMDEARSVLDMAAGLLSSKPWHATLDLRAELKARGISLPTSW